MEIILPKYYNPDNYDRSHRQIFLLETKPTQLKSQKDRGKFEDKYLFLISPFKSQNMNTYKDYISLNAKNIIYEWLDKAAKKKIENYIDHISTFPPNNYNHTLKKITTEINKIYGIKNNIQIVNKFNKTIYYELNLIKSKENIINDLNLNKKIDSQNYNKLIIPVIPYAFNHNINHTYISENIPNLVNIYESFINLKLIDDLIPGLYKPVELLVIDNIVHGIICESDLILACTKISYDIVKENINISHLKPSNRIYILYDEINKQFFEIHKKSLNQYENIKIRDYLYNHLKYQIMKNNNIIYNMDISTDIINKFKKILKIKDNIIINNTENIKIFTNQPINYNSILVNDLTIPINIPIEFKNSIISRLLYEMETRSNQKDDS